MPQKLVLICFYKKFLETQDDFKKPNKEGILWAIPDPTDKMKGLLHISRQSEYCKDVIVPISEKTSEEYIGYIKEGNYNNYVVGKDKCNLKKSFELLYEKHNAKTILANTGSIWSNLLIDEG